MRSRITVSGVALAVSVLGAFSTGSGVAGATPAAPPVAKTVTLTFASSGSTVLAAKGELVVVKLSHGHLRWSVAEAVQSTPVLKLVSERTTTSGASKTVFRVTNYGSAQLNATGTPICSTADGCPKYVLLWHANITVPVVDPPPPAAR
jgi:hypothetical protein